MRYNPIRKVLEKYSPSDDKCEKTNDAEVPVKYVHASKSETDHDMGNDYAEAGEAPVVKLLNSYLVRGYRTNASDIHVEPWEQCLVIKMRIDGQLVEYAKLDKIIHPSLVARAKIISGMDIAEKRLPQDGHCKVVIDGLEMNIRTSCVPTIYGEKVVLRFLDMDVRVDHEDTFGMSEENYRKVTEILKHPSGIIHITGPTGSGKTTTLYMILKQLVKAPVNIMTIEDPVEKTITGINQIQVNEQAGLTFEKGLRAILRQDPDVIMVGETRDNETARISVSAAITGHLVLSTLHTNDAVGAIIRMEDMGVEPYMVANSLSGVIAQRLARKVCPNCAEEVPISEEEANSLGLRVKMVRRGKGCHLCNHTGYKGRIAIHEVVVIDKKVRQMIVDRRSSEDIYKYVEETQKVRRLKVDMIRLVEQGITTTEELLRLTYGE